MIPHGTTVSMAAMMSSERLMPENIGFSLEVGLPHLGRTRHGTRACDEATQLRGGGLVDDDWPCVTRIDFAPGAGTCWHWQDRVVTAARLPDAAGGTL